jgi:hypothetical protein
MDDKALLGNDPVKQQWKDSDHCYAVAQYTGVNKGVEDVGYIMSSKSIVITVVRAVTSSDNRVVTECSTSSDNSIVSQCSSVPL